MPLKKGAVLAPFLFFFYNKEIIYLTKYNLSPLELKAAPAARKAMGNAKWL